MSDIYQNVTPEEERKPRPRRLLPIVLGLIVVFLAVAIPGVWLFGSRPRFYNFVAELSRSTTTVNDGSALRGTVLGREFRLTAENAYGLYTCLAVSGQGRELNRAPEGEPVAVLEYPDGAVLRMWPDEDGHAVIMLDFADGRQYGYNTLRVTTDTVLTRYLSPGNNRPWLDKEAS